MLEHPRLVLQSWTADTLSGRRRRNILAAAGHQPVGFAEEPGPARHWFWLPRPTLEVFETEDASLLLRVRRAWGWSPCYEVLDADDVRRGLFEPNLPGHRAPLIATAGADAIAAMRVSPHPMGSSASSWWVPLRELATVTPGREGTLLEFAASVQSNPFTKMVILAAALSLAGEDATQR